MGNTVKYFVAGMTCGHCVNAVTEELLKVPGVVSVAVDLRPEDVSVIELTFEALLDEGAILAAIDEAGYEMSQE